MVPVTGDPIDGGTVLVQAGRITAAGRCVLPGFIEAHGHVGVHEEGEGWAGSDTNDAISGGVLAVNVRGLIDGAEVYTAGASPEWAEPR